MKKNIKRTLMTAALVAVMAVCNAQIFIKGGDEEELSNRAATGDQNNEWIVVPDQGLTIDQYNYNPVGTGVWVLAGLAGAYALARSRKKK